MSVYVQQQENIECSKKYYVNSCKIYVTIIVKSENDSE